MRNKISFRNKVRYFFIDWKDKLFYNPRRGIPNLYKWFNTIYHDRDFDHGYLIDIMIKKMKFMADHFEDHKYFEGYEKVVAQIRECVAILEKTQDETLYYSDDIDKLEKEYNYTGWRFVPSPDHPGCSEMESTFKVPTTEEIKRELLDKKIEIYNRADAERKADLKKVFMIMAENLDAWWD